MHRSLIAPLLALTVAASLSGCAGLVVGGAVAGVGVAHDRRTAGAVVEDQSIELKAMSLIEGDPQLGRGTHISATSYNMAVLLSGETPTEALRERAERLVKTITGVRHVYNELAIAAPSAYASRSSDAWITAKVKTALLQVDGLRNFDPTRVKVVTERGIVYLMGILTAGEAEAVVGTVRRVDGVQKVVKLFEYTGG